MPTWLAPVQVCVMSFTDRNQKYGEKVFEELKREIPGLRIETDFSQTTVGSKVKEAEIMKVPYIVVVGDKEEKEKSLAVRFKGNSKIENIKLNDFVSKLKTEIENRL